MKRGSFLKRLAGLLAAPVVMDLDEELEHDWLLEEFEREFPELNHRPVFWLDQMLKDAWVEGRSPELVILSPAAYQEVLATAGVAAVGGPGRAPSAPFLNLYVGDFGTVRLFHARSFPWVKLNEHGACLLDEYPAIHRGRTCCFSGGPLNGQTRGPNFGSVRINVPVWDGNRTRRFTYVRDRRELNPESNSYVDIFVPLGETHG